MPSRRQQRVSDLIQEELAELLQRQVHDPRLSQVSITGVETSPDLRQARVYFSVLGDEAAVREVTLVLERASGYLRRELAPRLQLRYMPELSFRFDNSLATGSRIEELLHQIEDERTDQSQDGEQTEE